MKIVINGSELDTKIDQINSLGDLIAFVNSNIEGDSIIKEIKLDDNVINIDKRDTQLHNIETINVETTTTYRLADEALCHLTEHLEHLVPTLVNAASKFRVDEEAESNKYYLECLSSLKLFSDLLEGLAKMLKFDYSDIKINDSTLNEKIVTVKGILESMHSSQTKKDWIDLADIIEYELAPHLNGWIDILPVVREELKKRKLVQ